MARSSQSRQSGDQIRVNLNGDVADSVVETARSLGISYSAYVQLRLLGQLPPPLGEGALGPSAPQETSPVHSEPSEAVPVQNRARGAKLSLSDLPSV